MTDTAGEEPIYQDPAQTTPDSIRTRLLTTAQLLGGLDTSVGSWDYDVLNVFSIELSWAAFLPQNQFRRVFSSTASGNDLAQQAEQAGISSFLPGTAATGVIQITGASGTIVPAGTRVATNTSPPRTATTDQNIAIPSGQTVAGVSATDQQVGIAGNLPIGAYTRLIDNVAGVNSVTNSTAFTGGTNPETNDQLRARINQARQERGASANRAEVRTLALGVAGVGGVEVMYANTGTPTVAPGDMRVTIIDENGLPASATLVEAVRDVLSQPWRITSEAEQLTLSSGAVVDATQSGAIGTAVRLPPATAASIVQSRIDLVLPQGGPYELLPRLKRGTSVGAGNLLQIGVYDLTAGAWAKQSAISTADALYTIDHTKLPTSFDNVYVGDFFANLLDQLELRIIRQAADATTDMWVDEVFYRSAMQRSDISQNLPGFFRLRMQPAADVPIDISVTLTYVSGSIPASVNAAIRDALAGPPTATSPGGYLTAIPFGQGINQVVQVGSIGDTIFRTSGVASYDYSTLLVNGAQQNITILPEQRATLRDLTINGVAA
jgi:uncharacterized phage protein gp47/JayE